MQKILLSLCCLLVSLLYSIAQPTIEWAKVFGSSQGATIDDMQPTPDGNLIVLASANASDSDVVCTHKGGSDVWVFKIDMAGNILWQNCYGGSGLDDGFITGRILNTQDSGYIFMVNTKSFDGDITFNHGDDVWIVKIDDVGNIQWQKCYGGGGSEHTFSFIATPDGGYIFTALSNTVGSNGDIPFHYGTFLTVDAWVVKIDAAGNILWNKIFGGTGDDFLCSAAMKGDTVILFGWTRSIDYDLLNLDVDEDDGWIVSLDSAGNLLSMGVFGTDSLESFRAGLVTFSGNLIAVGSAGNIPVDKGYFHGNSDLWVVKTDGNGEIIWQGLYGGSDWDFAAYDAVKEAPLGSGYYIGAMSESADGDITNHPDLRKKIY
jgi:hypothetical protein